MKRLNIYALLLLAALLLISKGRSISITDRAIVHAAGIDRSDKGFSVTLQIFKPEAAGADTPVDISKANFKNITAEGKNVSECISSLTKKAGCRLFLGHMQLLVIGEEVSFDDIEAIAAPFREDKSIYPGLYLACAKNAGEIVSFPIKENAVTAENYRLILESACSRGDALLARFIDIDSTLDECSALAMPYLELIGREDERCLTVTGSKVLGRHGFYEDIITAEECAFLSMTVKEHTDITAPHELRLDGDIVKLGYKHTDISFDSRGGKLLCRIAVIAKADIGTDNKTRLSSLAAERIKATLKKYLIERDMDIVSLYKHLRFKKPALFAKYKDRLYELYDDMELSVSVTLYS